MSSTGWSALGKPPSPRQDRAATSRAASSRGIAEPWSSQYRALTWAMPVRAMPSRWASASGRSVSSLMTSAIASAQSCETLSTRSRTGDLVGQVGLEDQPERRAVAGHELEVGGDGRGDPLLVVVVDGQGLADERRRARGVLVEQGEVEVELAGEVLVQNGLGDPGPLGDVVHGGRVVAGLDEDVLGRLEQLGAAGGPRQAAWPRVSGVIDTSVVSFRCARAQAATAAGRARAAGAGRGSDESHPTRG